jgi:hypothetical protein
MTSIARLHVERTDDPAVLRWIVHDSAVVAAGDGMCAPDAASALGPLVGAGHVRSVAVAGGDLLVEMCDIAPRAAIVGAAHAAIAADLASRAAWLTERHAELPSASTPAPRDSPRCATCHHCPRP